MGRGIKKYLVIKTKATFGHTFMLLIRNMEETVSASLISQQLVLFASLASSLMLLKALNSTNSLCFLDSF